MPGTWEFTDDIDVFLSRAGRFLRSRPALHTTPLTALEKLRRNGSRDAVLGRLEHDGEVHAVLYRLPSRRLTLTPLAAEEAGTLAAHLAGLGHRFTGVTADHDTATAFARAWQRHTGATATPSWRGRLHRLDRLTPPEPQPEGRSRPHRLGTLTAPEPQPEGRGRLHRLGTLTAPEPQPEGPGRLHRLTPPEPQPEGRGRLPRAADHEEVVRWCGDFLAAVGETPAASWAASRFADKSFTFWETPGGVPVSMAGSTPMVGGMIRVDPVYTPPQFRGRGYAGAVTVAVSRAALDAGATDVVLFTDPANATSNALYRRVGYVPAGDFTGYDFT